MPKSQERNGQSFRELMSFLEKTDLCHVELEKGGSKFVFKRNPAFSMESVGREESVEEAVPQKENFFHVKSPMVGRFYRSNERNRPPLAVEGAEISAGGKVAVIEAMKIKKEVIAPYSGRVVRVLVRDGDPVEYGQDLIQVEHLKESE